MAFAAASKKSRLYCCRTQPAHGFQVVISDQQIVALPRPSAAGPSSQTLSMCSLNVPLPELLLHPFLTNPSGAIQ